MLYERQKEIDDETLKAAIATYCSECFTALLYGNAFAGSRSAKWNLIHDHTFEEILAEAEDRNLPIDEWHCAIPSDQLVTESNLYRAIREARDVVPEN